MGSKERAVYGSLLCVRTYAQVLGELAGDLVDHTDLHFFSFIVTSAPYGGPGETYISP